MTRERILAAELLDETRAVLRIDEFCARLHVERQWVAELVELGALEPRGSGGNEPSGWQFAMSDVPRVLAITRLVDELGVNLAGAAIIVELVGELRRLRRRAGERG
jgi:chaperone modulatory protein CbpM